MRDMATGNRGGRPKKPTQVHILAGNPSKIADLDRRAAAEPKPLAVSAPKPPTYLPKAAKRCWKENAALLSRCRLLTEADLGALEGYCMAYALYRQAVDELDGKSLVYRPQAGTQPDSEYLDERPQSRIIRAYMKEMRDWAREFGMTPAARGRMELPEADQPTDEMEQLLRGVK